MSRSGASMEALIGLAKKKLKEKKEAEAAAKAAEKLKSAAAKKRPFQDVQDIFMEDFVSESNEEINKEDKEDTKDSKPKKKKLSDLPKDEEEKVVKEPEVKAEEVPVNPMDAIMQQIASLEAEVGTFEKTKKGKKSKKRKKKHDSDDSDSDENEDETEPSKELEEKVEEEEETPVEVKGLGSLVTGYDSDDLSDEEIDLMKPEDLKPRSAPKLDDDFIFLKPKDVIPTNMIPPQIAGKPREKIKKIGLYDRLALAQQGWKMEENSENTPLSTKTESTEPVYKYNPMTGKREKVGPKPADTQGNIGPKLVDTNASVGTKEEQVHKSTNVHSPMYNLSSMMYNRYHGLDGKEEKVDKLPDTSKAEMDPVVTTKANPVEPASPQYKYNPLTGYRDLVETKPVVNPFSVGAGGVGGVAPVGFSVGAAQVLETVKGQKQKSICKFFNMKFGCRHGDFCHFMHIKYKEFNYPPNINENTTDIDDGNVAKAPSLAAPTESKDTGISPSEFYKTFIEKNNKQKKGAGVFFEKAKENPFPTNNLELSGKIPQSKQFDEHNGVKSKPNEHELNKIDNATNKREENTKRAQKTKEIFKSHREKKEIVHDLINEIIDTIFSARRFSSSKSRSRSQSLSLSSSSDEEAFKKNSSFNKKELALTKKKMRKQKTRNTTKFVPSKSRSRSSSTEKCPYQRFRSTSKSRKLQKSNSRDRTRERSRSRHHSRSPEKSKRRNKTRSRSRSPHKSRRRQKSRSRSISPQKSRRQKSRPRSRQSATLRSKSRSRSRDKDLESQSRSGSKPKVRVLSSSYLEQVRNGTTSEWNDETYKMPKQEQKKVIKTEVKEEKPNAHKKKRNGRKTETSNGSEGKQSLQGLEEWLSIEKNKESPKTLNDCIGIVTCILNENYAIAAVTLPNAKVAPNQRKGPFRVLFDTCEFWLENKTASDLSMSLEQVISVGDYVMINAILIDKPNSRNITYMATATMTSSDIVGLFKTKFVKGIAINNIKDVSKSKLENFDVVVSFLSATPIAEEELQIEMKSEKDADSNVLSKGKHWNNSLYCGIINKDSQEIEYIGTKSQGSTRDKNGLSEKTSKYNRKRSSSSPEDRYKKEYSTGSRDKYGMNGSKKGHDRNKSYSRSPERQNRKERDSRKKRSSRSPEKRKNNSRSQENEDKRMDSIRSHERRSSKESKENNFSRKYSSRSQENDYEEKGSDRSSGKERKRKRSRSRERKRSGDRSRGSKEKDYKRKLSTESQTSENGRELCSRLPFNFSYWNQNLIKCLDDGEYVDCVYCQETLATKPEHNFIPFYLDHYASPEHEQKLEQSSPRDQDCINEYIANSTELDYFIQLELERGAAEVIYDEGDLRLYMCKYCQKIGTTAWHFYKLKNSRCHRPENLPS